MRGRDKGIVNLRQWNGHYPAIIMNIVQFQNNQSEGCVRNLAFTVSEKQPASLMRIELHTIKICHFAAVTNGLD